MLWVALSLGPRQNGSAASPARLRAGATIIAALVFLQIVAGAFVAGLKAGAGYNTWPLMDGRLIPQGLGAMWPWWANLFENALTVQFNHRLLAYVLAIAVLWHLWSLMRQAEIARVHLSGFALALGVLAQIALGIWTLHRARAAGAGACPSGRCGGRVRAGGLAPVLAALACGLTLIRAAHWA